MKKLDLFLKLANFDKKTNSTDIVDVDSFTGEYSGLKLGNGGSWCRKSNIHPYKLVTMKRNGKFNFSWDPIESEKEEIETEFKSYKREPGPQIKYIKICGLQEDSNIKRPIRKDIKDFYKTQACCVCGSKSELVCDHKNDLYNDPRVLNTTTQTMNDFQSLCTHCNLLKRQIMKDTLKKGKDMEQKIFPLFIFLDWILSQVMKILILKTQML